MAIWVCAAPAQQSKSSLKESTTAPTEKNAAQIELLETKYRFETNGDSRKEVHARVRINNELGARQFARLNFDFNRSFQSVEIPLVRIAHPSGGIADILPSAVTDNANPAVVDYPAYQDVRVKSVRILGLQPDDLLEYRVITTTTHHPLAPDFWLDHTFDRTGVVSQEDFEIDLPATRRVDMKISPETPVTSSRGGQGDSATVSYVWKRKTPTDSSEKSQTNRPDISLSTFQSWDELADKLLAHLTPTKGEVVAMHEKVLSISRRSADGETGEIYEFVSQKIKTVDLPFDASGFQRRKPVEILQSGYGTPEDKFGLFAAMLPLAKAGFVLDSAPQPSDVPTPGRFDYLLTFCYNTSLNQWVDLNSEVAPEGMFPAQFHGKPIFVISPEGKDHWQTAAPAVVYKPSQRVTVRASIAADGILSAKVNYVLRGGGNELLLRVAFHQTLKEKWQDVAQMLALSDGFRGQITNVTASDPYATKEPFTVEYKISQLKFVDWSKKNAHIPAILPLPGLPDPVSATQAQSKNPIQLGTPLAIDLEATIELPAGATAQAPTGTTVNRDYATFFSKYSAQANILHAQRSLHFLSSELPSSRATDLNAFLHAVQADQTQLFTITPAPK